MKRKIFVLFTIVCLILTGCEAEPTPSMVDVSMEYSDFNLVADSKTGVVYIDNEFDYEGGFPAHVYTPYYGRNGKPCRFVDGKVVEVE